MAPLEVQARLLGAFSLRVGGMPALAANGARLQALLAYLFLQRATPTPRHQLAALFWPDADEAQARNNLRQLLHQLRRALPAIDHCLHVDVQTIGWRAEAAISLDVADVERALAHAEAAERRGDAGAQRQALEEAVACYGGDLLPSCYDDWIAPERERLHQQCLAALARLVRLLEEQRDYAVAIRHAQAWLRLDPLAEDGCRALMRLYALTDDRAAALRTYDACATALRRELGVEPVPATRALHERLRQMPPSPAPSTTSRSSVAAPTFIGRAREWAQLQTVWQQASTGSPRFALVTGEAGIGKSRLAEELLTWARRQGIVTAQARSYAAEGRLSLAPVTTWLRGDDIYAALSQLEPVWRGEVARLLPELAASLGVLPPPAPITEYGQRQRFFEALARALLAAPPPLLLLIDDMQWCDPETLEWLHFLLRFDATAPLLVVGCARAEELAAGHPVRALLRDLEQIAGARELALTPLDAAETARLAAQIVGRDLGGGAAQRLYQETDGVPLFVIETARAPELAHAGALDSAAPLAPDRLPLPPRVYSVMAGRLAQLSAPARALVGLAAAIGHAFTLDLLLAASGDDEAHVVQALDELWTRRIIYEQGANRYDFSHDRLLDVAYAETSVPQRRLLHHRIAQALAAGGVHAGDALSGEIAAQYERAGLTEQAIPHYVRAADVAQRVYANDDAIILLSRALALVQQLPASVQRDRQELELLLLLAPALRVAKGWAAPELEQALERAQALCARIGDDRQRTQVLDGLQSLYVVRGKLETVQYLYDELDALHRRTFGKPPPLFAGIMTHGARLHLGHLAEANDGFAKSIAVYDPEQLERLQVAQGVNYMVLARAWHAHALWCLGYPASALDRGRDAVQLARDLGQPFNQALAATYLAMLAQFGADPATARRQAEEALALTTDYQAPYYRAWSGILVCYAHAQDELAAEHAGRLRTAIAAFTAAGARLRLPYFLALLAQVHAKAGRTDEGLVVIDEAFAASRANNERWWDAELHRLHGELLLASGDAPAAEAALRQALAVARSQQAKSLELRAALAWARLERTQRRDAAARQLLADLSPWFTEGFETPDLAAARALLAERS